MHYATKSGAVLVAALALSAGTAQASQRVTEIPLAQYAVPNTIVAGPDGAMYASDSSLGKVWRISDTGKVRSFDVGGGATGIASAHGALWVSERDGARIIRLGLDGSKQAYPVTPGAFPGDIVEGSDGALWFTESRGNAIGRLSPAGKVTEYPLPTPDAFVYEITPGPDGALWFTETLGNKIGRITTDGAITEYMLPGADSYPGPIVTGPDGALWFGEYSANKIGRMTTDGVLTGEFALPKENATPLGLAVGPDGALYIAQHSTGTIARMTLDGTVTKQFRLPSGSPDALGVGPDGDVWFTQGNFGQVGRLDLRYDPPITATGTTFAMKRFVSAERTVATFTDPDPEASYAVTIKWGDGSTSAGWVRRAGSGFEVRGRHTYDKDKTYGVTVKIDKTRVESTAIVSK